MSQQMGLRTTYDEAALTRSRDGDIAAFEDQLRVEEALRTVLVASPDALAVRPSEAPSTAAAEAVTQG